MRTHEELRPRLDDMEAARLELLTRLRELSDELAECRARERDTWERVKQLEQVEVPTLHVRLREVEGERDNWERSAYGWADECGKVDEKLAQAEQQRDERVAEVNAIWEEIAGMLRWPADGPLPSEKNMLPALTGLLATIPSYQRQLAQAEQRVAGLEVAIRSALAAPYDSKAVRVLTAALTPPPPAPREQG